MTPSPPTVPQRAVMTTAVAEAQPSGRPVIVGAALFAVATLTSLLGSWNVSLWADEAVSLSAAERPLTGLFALVSRIDGVHALYYLMLHAWGSLAGFSPVAVRLPSAVAVGVAVMGVHRLMLLIGPARLAVPAALVAAVVPRLTWSGIEARSFAPSAAIAVWATVLLLAALRSGRWRWFVYAALVALGVGVNVYLALLVVSHLVTVLLLERGRIRPAISWLCSAVVGVAAAAPVVVLALGQRGQLGDADLSLAATLRLVVVNQFFLGATPTPVDGSNDGTALWAVAAVLLAAVSWAAAAFAVVTAVRKGTGRRALAVAVPWVVVPTALVVGYSLVASPLYNPRYFTFAAPAMAVLVTVGLDRARLALLGERPAALLGERPAAPLGERPAALRNRIAIVTAAVVVVALCAPIYLSQRSSTGKSGTDWSQVAAWVDRTTSPGDGVFFAPSDGNLADPVARTTRLVAVAYPQPFRDLVDVTLRTTGAHDDTLTGTSHSLEASIRVLAGLDRLVVVQPDDYPAVSAASDEKVLAAAGFALSGDLPHGIGFRGPMDEVRVFVRR